MTELVRFTAHGHPAVRATHGKTLELTAEPAIGERATCVVGVAAGLPDGPVAGPIRLTLSAEGETVSCRAVGNSAWWPATGSAVIRRSGQRLPDTFATDAELAAADLPRSLARALTSPAAILTVLVERAPGPAGGTLVRCRAAGIDLGRLRAEAAAAELVLVTDPAARPWLAAAGIDAASPGSAASRLSGGGRVLAVDGNQPADLGSLLAAAETVEVLGVPAEHAVLAAAPGGATAVLHGGGVPPRELPVLAAANPALPLVVRCPAGRLARLLADCDRAGSQLVLAPLDDPERPHRGRLADLPLPDRGDVACWVAARPGAEQAAVIDPAALVRQLHVQSVTPRTIALAVAALPGWSRRSAYEFVLALTDET